MEQQEFKTLAMAIRTYYPKENILPNAPAMELWFRELQDIPFPVAETALRKWVSTEKWSPSIAEMREMCAEIQFGTIPTWGEAWEQVMKAVRKYGVYRADAALASLDQMTRQAVEQVGFYEICMSENIGVERANFRMVYESLADREKARQTLPLPLQKTIEQLGSSGVLKLSGERKTND